MELCIERARQHGRCLSGAESGQEMGSFYNFDKQQNGGYCFAVLDISKILDRDTMEERVDQILDSMKDCPKGEGVSEIMTPGEIEYNRHEKALKEGISLSKAVTEDLLGVSEHYSVPFPKAAI